MGKKPYNRIYRSVLLWMVLFSLAGCGKRETQRCIYEEEDHEFGVEIPMDWTYETYGWDATEDMEASPEVGLCIYINGEEENRILVQRHRAVIRWQEDYDMESIRIGDQLYGLFREAEEERDQITYILTDVVIEQNYSISMCLKEDVYAANKKEIDALIQSFQILR